MDTASAIELLRQLSPDEIRRRLEAIASEEKELRTLLRAALRLNAKEQRQEVTP
jgi:hypothetical protein